MDLESSAFSTHRLCGRLIPTVFFQVMVKKVSPQHRRLLESSSHDSCQKELILTSARGFTNLFQIIVKAKKVKWPITILIYFLIFYLSCCSGCKSVIRDEVACVKWLSSFSVIILFSCQLTTWVNARVCNAESLLQHESPSKKAEQIFVLNKLRFLACGRPIS